MKRFSANHHIEKHNEGELVWYRDVVRFIPDDQLTNLNDKIAKLEESICRIGYKWISNSILENKFNLKVDFSKWVEIKKGSC